MKSLSAIAAAFIFATSASAQQQVPVRNWTVPSARRIAAQAALSSSSEFVPVTPCRVYDSRLADGPIATKGTRTIAVTASSCGIPSSATAFSLNFTVLNSATGTSYAFITAYPTGSTRPSVSTLNFKAGSQVANAAIVPAGTGGSVDVYASLQTDVIVDVNGYFTSATGSNVFPSSGSVGIGTAAPSSTLQVVGDLRLGSNGANTDIRIFTDTPQTLGGTSFTQVIGVTPVTIPASGTTRSAIYFKNATANGQGTNQLDVVVDGNIAAKYQDVAELVPSDHDLAAGTVVVLDSANLKHVRASSHAYDTAVAGVISAQPGITLGIPSEGTVKVATTGRVKVHVDASRGAIAVGDLLVTSDKNGTAMKSTPVEIGGVSIHRPGTIIGKAIEPLASGEGDVLVLLSLQ